MDGDETGMIAVQQIIRLRPCQLLASKYCTILGCLLEQRPNPWVSLKDAKHASVITVHDALAANNSPIPSAHVYKF